MKAVKGSKQHEMVVVPYRPWYRAGIFCIFLVALAAFSWLTYQYGVGQGMATRVQVVRERDEIKKQLKESKALIDSQRQQIADLKVGNQVDARANEEVRQTVASLQSKIADLDEQISFYKAVMLPNADEKGLRIERLDLKATDQPEKYHFSLLLTQIVDKHNYIEGGVQISVLGTQGDQETSIPLAKISAEASNAIKFRFRYFQNIDGDLTIPDGFTPKQFDVVAQAAGRNGQRLEKKFQWHIGEG